MNEKRIKPRIALFGVGTLGGDKSGQGIPVLADLFEKLSEHYEIVFYSFTRINRSNISRHIQVRQIISIRFPWRLKYFFLFIQALVDHFRSPYAIIFSVSVYPSGLFAILLGKILRKHVVVQLIASEAAMVEGVNVLLNRPWIGRVTRYVCRKADTLIVVADYQKELAKKDLPTSREIVVLPLRINPKKFHYRRRTLSYPIQFIQVAFYSPIKDQITMFKAFSLISKEIDCHLTVIGEGFESLEVQNMLRELRIKEKVRCLGFISQTELPQYYDKADILLHTAIFETGCAVIQEAMASGVAVCGTNVGLLADIGTRYAVVVQPKDPERLAFEVLSLVKDKVRFDEITREAHQWISQFNAEWAAANYHAFLNKLIQ